MSINSKYYNRTMNLLNTINTIRNDYVNNKNSYSGRFKYLHIAGKASLTGIKLLAIGVSLVAVAAFETLLFPYNKSQNRKKVNGQILKDLQHMHEDTGIKKTVDDLKNEIRAFIQTEGLFKGKTETQIERYVNKAAATYASSRIYYAPVVVEWVHSVLETSKAFQKDPSSQPHRVIFLARDGIPAYEIAKELIRKYPEKYADIPVSLLYISRKVKDWTNENEANKQMLIDYAKQEGVQKDDKCMVIDIGFFGSMIQPIKDAFQDLTEDIQFGYLVSHTQQAYGFMGNLTEKLDSVIAAGQNPAVHWLEDTHQGVKNSATKLVQVNGKIIPYITDKFGQETCKVSSEKSYLYKYFGMQALMDGEEELDITTDYLADTSNSYLLKQWKMATEESKGKFDAFLMEYFKGIRKSFTKHF